MESMSDTTFMWGGWGVSGTMSFPSPVKRTWGEGKDMPRIAGVLATTERRRKISTAKGPRGAGAEFEKMRRWSLSVISQRMKSVTHL
jgi:hypothetical protein